MRFRELKKLDGQEVELTYRGGDKVTGFLHVSGWEFNLYEAQNNEIKWFQFHRSKITFRPHASPLSEVQIIPDVIQSIRVLSDEEGQSLRQELQVS